jgi:uncharacterized protein
MSAGWLDYARGASPAACNKAETMQFNLDLDSGSYTIRGYQPGRIAVTAPLSGADAAPQGVDTVAGSLIISPRRLLRDWAPQSIDELLAEHLAAIAALQPEVILLGTGVRLVFPPAEVLAAVQVQGIGIEVMDTAAACRTYNILMAEGRRVAAGLINPVASGE